MSHSFISIAAELARENEQAAHDAVNALGNPLKEPLAGIIASMNRMHFFSMTVVPGDEGTPPFLVLELSADGDADSLLAQLADKAGAYFEPAFKLAKDYSPSRLLAFWKSHLVTTGMGYMDTPGLAHTGTPGMSVERIHREAELAKAVNVIYCNADRNRPALELLETIRAELRTRPGFEWAFAPEPADLLRGEQPRGLVASLLGNWLSFVKIFLWPVFLIASVLSVWMMMPLEDMEISTVIMALLKIAVMTVLFGGVMSLVFVGWVYTSLRALETSDIPDDTPPDHEKMTRIRLLEDHAYQNHLAGVSIMKGGMIRQIAIRLIFWMIATLAKGQYRPGFLSGIGTIHFARWFMLPGTNRLLFFSNYGGSWESYLEDFITKANAGLTGVWSNTIGFPRTSNLVVDGASDGDRFKRWARRQCLYREDRVSG